MSWGKEEPKGMRYFYRWDEEEKISVGPAYSTGQGPLIKGEKVQIALVHKPRGTGANPHTHPNEQFNIVMQGTLRAMVEGQEELVRKGGIVYIPANARHYTVATEEEDVVFIAVKDMSWGIAGIAEDKNAGAYYAPGVKAKGKQKK